MNLGTRDPTESLRRVWEILAAPYSSLKTLQVAINYGKTMQCGRAAFNYRHGANPVVIVNAEDLVRDGFSNAPRLLAHELAHLLAAEQGLNDTSKEGAYHNSRFREVADQIGLPVVYTGPTYGWRPDPEGVFPRIAELLQEDSLTLDLQLPQTLPKRPARNNLKTECSCGRIVRMSAATYSEGGVKCMRCGKLFKITE